MEEKKAPVYVYHGTTKEAAEKIVKTQEIWDSNSDAEWLGSGAYFFPYLYHAHNWIKKQGKIPGMVVEANLEYDEEDLLDLDDPMQMEQMNTELAELFKKAGKKIRACLPEKKDELWRMWCFGCNAYRELHPGQARKFCVKGIIPQSRRSG